MIQGPFILGPDGLGNGHGPIVRKSVMGMDALLATHLVKGDLSDIIQ